MTKISRENGFQFCLLLFVFSIPISQDISIKLLIVSVLLSLFLIGNKKWKSELFNNSWDLILYFVILAVGLIYTDQITDGLSVLEKNLSFLVVPLLFSRIRTLDKNQLHLIVGIFTAGVLIASFICLGYAIWRDVQLGMRESYYYDEFTAIIDSHPTYMAYYVCFSILFLLHLVSYEITSRLTKVFLVVGILYLSSILMLTAGRSTFVSLLMMSSFFFLKLLFEPYPVKQKLQGISITVVLLVILLFQSPYAQRMFPDFMVSREVTLNKMKGDTWERMILWQSAIKASSNIVIGVGTGDYTEVMNHYYRINHLSEFAESSFNAHNEFIQIVFSNGLLGLAGLMIIIIRPIFLAARRQNIFGMLTFFPFLIYGISEVFLGRYQGIIFFILLHQIFVKYLLKDNEKISVKSF